jgi:type IV pilus assembly protein PilV
MNKRHSNLAHAGFTLVETLVALLVISVGLLGIAKMQALALSSTGTARMRSIAALDAASLGAMMHADRAYWSAITAADVTDTVQASDGTFTSSDAAVTTQAACTKAAPCTAQQLAGYDLGTWGTVLKATMPPNATATIICKKGTATVPVTCTIQLNWTENLVELNTGMNAGDTAANNNTALQNTGATHFILYVEP